MAKINWTNKGIGVGVGIIDIVAEKNDATNHRTAPFRNATDIVRTVLAVGGIAGEAFMPRQAKWFDPLATAAMPLFVKTLANVAMPYLGMGSPTRLVGRGMMVPAGVPANVSARRTYVPEFDKVTNW